MMNVTHPEIFNHLTVDLTGCVKMRNQLTAVLVSKVILVQIVQVSTSYYIHLPLIFFH